MEDFQHDIEIISVILYFGALLRVQNIFQCQCMETENLSRLFQKRDILKAVDVDPGDAFFVRRWSHPLQSMDLLFVELEFVKLNKSNFRMFHMSFPDMNEGAGRKAGFDSSSFRGFGHVLCPSGFGFH